MKEVLAEPITIRHVSGGPARKFSFYFKWMVGVTPGRFRLFARKA